MKLKISKSELMILVIVLIIGSGFLYYKFVLASQIEQIKQLDADIEAVKHEIQLKDAEFKKVASIKEEITQIDMNLNASKMKIMSYPETAKRMILLQDYIKLNDLSLEKIELKEPVEKILGEENSKEKKETHKEKNTDEDSAQYGEISINLELYGQYEDLKTFVEQVRASIKPFVINKIEIAPKEEEEGSTKSEDDIQAKIELYTYTLLKDPREEKDLLNYNFMEYEYEYKNPFKPVESIEDKISNEIKDVIEEQISDVNDLEIPSLETEKTVSKVNDFIIAIKDVYASGDNFYIVGPGNKSDYTTIQTRTIEPVNFYLTVNPTGYEYTIESRDQEMKTYQKEMPLEKCRVIVDSTVMAIRNNQELKTGIFLTNNTGKLLNVELKGNYLEKIYIYTPNGAQIKPGETKENIQVRIIK